MGQSPYSSPSSLQGFLPPSADWSVVRLRSTLQGQSLVTSFRAFTFHQPLLGLFRACVLASSNWRCVKNICSHSMCLSFQNLLVKLLFFSALTPARNTNLDYKTWKFYSFVTFKFINIRIKKQTKNYGILPRSQIHSDTSNCKADYVCS